MSNSKKPWLLCVSLLLDVDPLPKLLQHWPAQFRRFTHVAVPGAPLKTNISLKIDGKKMKSPFKMVPFSGDMLIFGGRYSTSNDAY